MNYLNIPSIKIATDNLQEPIKLDFLKAHLRIDSPDEDMILRQYLLAACDFIEVNTGRAWLQKTYTQTFDYFECHYIPLGRSPAASITSVQYLDSLGNTQTLSSAVYGFNSDVQDPSYIYLKDGQSWPSLDNVPSAVKINYVAGYLTDTAIPARQVQAALFLTAHLFQNRVPVAASGIADVPFTLKALIDQLKISWLQ